MVNPRRDGVVIVFVGIEYVEIGRLEGIGVARWRVRDRLHGAVKRADAVLGNHVAGKRRASPLGVGGERVVDVRLNVVIVEDFAEVAGEHLWGWNKILVK